MNKILDDDRILCTKMIGSTKSENERNFFSSILKKESQEIALSGDLLMSEHYNDLKIYILRENYDEYRTGVASTDTAFPEVFADGIKALLSVPLKSIGLNIDITIGDWLHEIDYNGIDYNANYDLD